MRSTPRTGESAPHPEVSAPRAEDSPVQGFSPAARAWFSQAFAAPTPAQVGAWRAAVSGEHALVVAPTGSGKTLAAFLWAVDQLLTGPVPAPQQRLRVVYVSPLKALAADIERNLSSPLVGIGAAAARMGKAVHDVRVGVRTGDTPAKDRRAMVAHPPDILITTPESLYLMLTSQARSIFQDVTTVIVDEVHAVAGTKRGAHLAVTLERLDALLSEPAQRIGLSATVEPHETVARFLVGHRPLAEGGRPVRIVTSRGGPRLELSLRAAVEDFTDPAATRTQAQERERAAALAQRSEEHTAEQPSEGTDSEAGVPPPATSALSAPSVWPALTDEVVDLITAHRSTIVFTSSRRTAERLTSRINTEWAARNGDDPGPAEAHPHPAVPGGLPAEIMSPQDSLTPATDGLILARAHHGSMSREERTRTEEELKSGQLRAVVATSSLELGIDMGAVDLVIQVGAPPSVASALQRIGRAGHQVGVTSHSVWLPTHRGDLMTSLVVAREAAQGNIEQISIPVQPLDVLAQQVVALVSGGEMTVAQVAALVRRAASFHELSREALEGVLDMLSGRYPSEDFADLRPRMVWDRTTDVLSARPGAQRLAITSGGTIPDRGLYGVFLAQGPTAEAEPQNSETVTGHTRGAGRRVGELDEEMVFESRVGDLFTLGTSTWRIEAITPDRVLVSPAAGVASRLPFWRSDGMGRPASLGRKVGAHLRAFATEDEAAMDTSWGAARLSVDDALRANLRRYIREQEAATGHLPDERTIVIEKFRDELGDWRFVLHSPLGARVLAPWSLVIGARLRERTGMNVQIATADDGIVWRMPDTAVVEGGLFGADSAHADGGLAGFGGISAESFRAGSARGDGHEPALNIQDVLIEPAEVSREVVRALAGSAHLAARFREAAARSLLLPKRNPGKRQPLWQQRHRAAQLFSVASRHDDFPVLLEAVRESLRQDYDVPALVELMRQLSDGAVRLVEVTTGGPSPFARSLLMGYTASFLYDEDAPAAERRASALALSPALLAELVGSELGDLADLLDPAAVAQVTGHVGLLHPSTQARNIEDAADVIRRLGPLDAEQLARRVAPAEPAKNTANEAGDDATNITAEDADAAAATAEAPAEAQNAGVGASNGANDGAGDGAGAGAGAAVTDQQRSRAQEWIRALERQRRVMMVRVAGREQVAVIEDAARLRDALGTALPPGLPTAVLEQVPHPLIDLARRHARTHGAFTIEELAQRFGLGIGALEPVLDALTREGVLTRGRITPGSTTAAQYVDAEVLRRMRRLSLANLRQDVEAVPGAALAAHLAHWQSVSHIGARPLLRGESGLVSVVDQLAGVTLPSHVWEDLALPSRVDDLSPALIDRLTSSGDVVWVGAGRLPGGDGLIALLPREALADLLPSVGELDMTALHQHLLDQLGGGGAKFFADLVPPVQLDPLSGHPQPGTSITEVTEALWDLVWAGLVTNDTLGPLRALRQSPPGARSTARSSTRAAPARSSLRSSSLRRAALSASLGAHRNAISTPPTVAGRWSLVPRPEPLSREEQAAARAIHVLDLSGVVVRGIAGIDGVPGGFGGAYQVMRRLEDTGQVRRGYLVDGLGGSQFALPEVVDRLRAQAHDLTARQDRRDAPRAHVVSATDPAQPYGSVLEWPAVTEDAPRPTRTAGAIVVLVESVPVLYLGRGGGTLTTFVSSPEHLRTACTALASQGRAGWIRAGTRRGVVIEKINGAQALRETGEVLAALTAAGFLPSPQGLRLRGE